MTAADRISRAQLATLVSGQQADAYTLPTEIDQALRAEAFLAEQLHAARHEVSQLRSTGEVIGKLADDTVEAAMAGTSPPDFTARVVEAELAERAAQLKVSVLEQALESASYRVLAATDGDRIIRDHLKPAFEAALEAVRKAAPRLAGFDVTVAEAFLDAPPPVRAAFNALRVAQARYNAIRAAQRACHTLAGGTGDGAGTFAELRNSRQLYGDRWQGHLQSSWTPWPDHALSYLVWLVSSDAQPWVPTVTEVNQAVEELMAAQPRRRQPVAF